MKMGIGVQSARDWAALPKRENDCGPTILNIREERKWKLRF